MKRRWLVLTGVAAILLIIGAGLLGRTLGTGPRARFPSSFSGGPEGLLAFRRLLSGLEIPNRARTTPWDDLDGGEPVGVLVVALPLQREVDAAEETALRGWISRGGALLMADDATLQERPLLLDRFFEEAGLNARTPPAEPDLRTLLPARPARIAASGTPAGPAGSDLGRLMLLASSGFTAGEPSVPLALSREGEVLAASALMGKGRIVRVLGPTLSNDQLLAGDTLVFGLRLVETLRRGGPVLFDEFHHGFGGALAAARGLNRSALVLGLGQVLLATLIFAAARGIRFGPPAPAREVDRRTGLEFVDSMASLYRRAGARRHVLDGMLARFLREARTRWALPPGEDLEDIAGHLASRTRLSARRIADTLLAARDARFERKLDDKALLARADAMARLEKEVLGGD